MRRRIVALTVLAAVLAIGLFGLPLAAAVARYYLEDERAELERVAEAAALSVADELIRDQRPLQLPPAQPETRLALYSPTGQFETGNGPADADPAVIAAQRGDVATSSGGGDLVVAVPIADTGTVVGVVRAATPYSEVYLRTAVTWLAMVGLSVLAVGAAWLMARGMARRLTRPLDELSHAAQQLGEGDFIVRTSRAGIPEIDSVASAMETTAHRLGEILARERAFSANASHQLRTPLAGLRLQLEAALDSRDPDPRPAIQASIDAADRLERTINDLLLLARTSGSGSAPVDLDELLAEVRESWGGLLAAQGRELLVPVPAPGAGRPNASAAAIRQVLAVLLDNATTHGAGTVTVTARDAGDVLAIDVSDEGAGIDADLDPFTQRREGDGRGIGLALARGLAEGEGGRLWLRKPVPPTFTLLLPIAESPDP